MGNIPENATHPGQTTTPEENIPGNAIHPGQTVSAERKCPGKRHKTRTNHHPRRKISQETPYIRDKPSQQKENVLENATKPGQTTTPEEKYPGKRHTSGTKQKNGDPQASIIRKCKSTDSHLKLILLNLCKLLVGLCNLACKVCLEFLKLGKQVSICTCKNLHCKDSCVLCSVQSHGCNRDS